MNNVTSATYYEKLSDKERKLLVNELTSTIKTLSIVRDGLLEKPELPPYNIFEQLEHHFDTRRLLQHYLRYREAMIMSAEYSSFLEAEEQ